MRIGMDLGGTKIEVIALGHDGATLLRHRVPTPAGDYVATVTAVGDLVRPGREGIRPPGQRRRQPRWERSRPGPACRRNAKAGAARLILY
jgi:ROK family